jgi:hypothetical protein
MTPSDPDFDDDDLDLDEMQAYVQIEHLRAENNMLFDRAAHRLAELKEAQARMAELRAAAIPALEWIDEIYPADIFDGSSGDEGPVRIVAIRENLRRALQEQVP